MTRNSFRLLRLLTGGLPLLGVLAAEVFVGAQPGYASKPNLPAAVGDISEYTVPTTTQGDPYFIAAGPDGNLWFTDDINNQVAKVTTSGAATAYRVPTQGGGLAGIVAGPDGNLWFANGSAIGKVTTSGVFTEYTIPTANSFPYAIVVGPDGNLWFTEDSGNKVARVTTSGAFTEYPLPAANAYPTGIAAGADGNLWLTEGANKVAKVTTSGVFTEYATPTANSYPSAISAGPDGNLWFAENGVSKVAKVTTSGAITEYPLPTANAYPNGIAAGPDGNLWFTEGGVKKVAKVTTSGVFTEYPVPPTSSSPFAVTPGPDGNVWFSETQGGGGGGCAFVSFVGAVAKVTTSGALTEYRIDTASSGPGAITAGPDGNLWFTEDLANKVAKVTTSGTFTEYALPTARSLPGSIAAGSDGNLWFTEGVVGKVAKVTTSGVITEYAIPNSCPSGIAAGPDGNLWFTDSINNQVGRVTTSGVFTEYAIPTANAYPGGIAAGPDGNLWFTESGANQVARVTTSGAFTEYPISTANSFPSAIAPGPDGNLWFTEDSGGVAKVTTSGVVTEYVIPTPAIAAGIATGPDANLWFTEGTVNQVARVTTSGAFTEFPVPTASSYPYAIAAGPDGNLWFTEIEGNKVAKVVAGLPPPTITSISPDAGPEPGGTSVTIDGTGFVAGSTSVSFGPVSASSVHVLSSTQLTVDSPPGTGNVAVVVSTTNGSTSGNSSNRFTYLAALAALPAMANAAYGGYTTVTYVQNAGSAPADLGILYFDQSGNRVGSGEIKLALPTKGNWTVRQDDQNGLTPGGAGSAIIYGDQPIAAFVNEFAPHNAGDATSYSAIPLPGGAGATLSAPAIASNAYGGYTTAIGLINLASTATDITLTYRKGDGTIQATQTLTGVAPGAYRGVYSGNSGSSTDANLPANFAGTATIQSSAGTVAAIVNEVGPGGQFSSYDAVAAGAATEAAPTILNDAYGGYNTAIGLQDLAATTANVTISYSGQVGGGTTTQTFQEHLTLAPFGYAGDYNGGGSANAVLPDGFHGSATIQSDQPLASIVNEVAAPAIAGGPTTQSTAYNTFAAGVGAAHLPLVENAGSDGVTTGVGIENISATTASVMIAYYDATSGGLLTQKTVNIAPGSFLGEYTPADLTTAGTRATAVISTSANALAVIVNEVGAGEFMSYDAQ
jgi:streptogramin lyase